MSFLASGSDIVVARGGYYHLMLAARQHVGAYNEGYTVDSGGTTIVKALIGVVAKVKRQ